MGRFLRFLAALFALSLAGAASAKVEITFHSFNGSALWGRFPHTFIALDGTLDGTGEKVHQNYGWTAVTVSPAVLQGPVKGEIYSEQEKWLAKTNRHFTIQLTDAQYREVMEKIAFYRAQPGKFYSLETNNCIHFVGEIAKITGLKVDYPKNLLRKPRAWLNRVGEMNPQLNAKKFG